MNKIPTQVSESVKRLNPHLYGLGAIESQKRQPDDLPALARRPRERKTSQGVMVVCTLCVHSSRELDDDNLQGACKFLRDGIAEAIGFDDGDKRVRWQYQQVVTIGSEGVVVTIEKMSPMGDKI